MNSTIDYYNSQARDYFDSTSEIDLTELYEVFLQYIPEGGRIIDLGCGSGRDVKWFIENGYRASGIDASSELIQIARERWGIPVEVGLIEEWVTEETFDGIWCCGSLMHLDFEEVKQFFAKLKNVMKKNGVLFMSVKSGIKTGEDEIGRFFENYTEKDIKALVEYAGDLKIQTMWYTEDRLAREDFRWLNAIIKLS